MLKIFDVIDIYEIQQELSNFSEFGWKDTQNYINPTNYANSTLSKEAVITGKNALREQDRVHLIWQSDHNGCNNYWWKDPDWRNKKPAVTYHGRMFFLKTINLLFNFYAKTQQQPERIFFSRLRPGCEIYPHTDGAWGKNYESNLRHGLVISTNEKCSIASGPDTLNPQPGTMFIIDNNKEHSAKNHGLTDRVYIFMDVKNIV